MHTHDYDVISLEHGLIHAFRVDHHPTVDLDEHQDWDYGHCAICAGYIWLSIKASHFIGMNPHIPVLCCLCSEMSREAIEAAVPDVEFMRREVPDLARLGTFN